MIFTVEYDDDGWPTLVLDDAGIDWLEQGLAQLRDEPTGGELSAPGFSSEATHYFTLRRA